MLSVLESGSQPRGVPEYDQLMLRARNWRSISLGLLFLYLITALMPFVSWFTSSGSVKLNQVDLTSRFGFVAGWARVLSVLIAVLGLGVGLFYKSSKATYVVSWLYLYLMLLPLYAVTYFSVIKTTFPWNNDTAVGIGFYVHLFVAMAGLLAHLYANHFLVKAQKVLSSRTDENIVPSSGISALGRVYDWVHSGESNSQVRLWRSISLSMLILYGIAAFMPIELSCGDVFFDQRNLFCASGQYFFLERASGIIALLIAGICLAVTLRAKSIQSKRIGLWVFLIVVMLPIYQLSHFSTGLLVNPSVFTKPFDGISLFVLMITAMVGFFSYLMVYRISVKAEPTSLPNAG